MGGEEGGCVLVGRGAEEVDTPRQVEYEVDGRYQERRSNVLCNLLLFNQECVDRTP